MFDIAGREVFQEAFTSSHSINTEQLAKGTYLYELRSKNGIIKIGKVVKD
ncbi:MAG: T9SS type A sorting domain-containing protein [Bacteroidetes bacterium]|nr:T9SS type A sorting domain-containing protein [Bacteroidota bacterium]